MREHLAQQFHITAPNPPQPRASPPGAFGFFLLVDDVHSAEPSGTDGVRTFTPGVHVVRLAWSRMTYIGIYPDTVGLVATLQRLSRAGVAEATAQKIQG